MMRRFLTAAAVACVVCWTDGLFRSAPARSENVVVQMPIYGQISSRDFTSQVEQLAAAAITQQFNQNPNAASVQVVMLGDRNGEIIPILTATITRTQWQTAPRVNVWSQYYRAAYALLQRSPAMLAAVPTDWSAFQSQKSQGYLTGAAAQARLSSMD